MTAPDHTIEADVVDDPVELAPVDLDEPATPDVDWQRQAEAYRQVLDLAGIPVNDDGSFNPSDLEEWHARIESNNIRARKELFREAGFNPESVEAELISQKIDAGEIPAHPDAVGQYAASRGWEPNYLTRETYLTWKENQMLDGQEIEDFINAHSRSEPIPEEFWSGEYGARIEDARARGDYMAASMLQSEMERKRRRR